MDTTTLFDESYYRHGCGAIPYERNPHWLSFFGGIAGELIRSFRPQRVFDAGCAWGFLVESFNDRGVDAWGVDISEFAIAHVRSDMRTRCRQASLTEPIQDGPFDLITCIEVLEHMPAAEGEIALDNLCAASDRILFSSTPSDFEEATHVNVQPVIHWLRAFAKRGLWPDLAYDASFIAPHAFLVKRTPSPGTPDGLTLLSETIRLRVDRVAFLNRHNEIMELRERNGSIEAERLGISAKLREAHTALEKTGSALQETQLTLDASRLALGSERELAERLGAQAQSAMAELETVTAGRDELANQADQLSEQAGRLRMALDDRDLALASQVAEAEAWKIKSSQHADEAAEARIAIEPWIVSANENARALEEMLGAHAQMERELLSVRSSPGWQLVLRYRDFLKQIRTRNGWFRKHVDPAISALLVRCGLAQSSPGPFSQYQQPAQPAPAPGPAQTSRPEVVPLPASSDRPAPAYERTIGETSYEEWTAAHEPSADHLQIQQCIAECLGYRPLLSIVVPLYKTPLAILREMVHSVQAQTYGNWELCVSAGKAEDAPNLVELAGMSAKDPRIRVLELDRNLGISDSSNAALQLASGEFIVLLDHDDTLAPFALYEIVSALNRDPGLSFLYSDKDQISAGGTLRISPLFKPQWSPELMWNANYLTHLCAMRASDVRAAGGWRKDTDGAQDWDLFLRVIRLGGKVAHIPKVLYHWRQIGTSVSSGGLDAKPYAADGQVRAVTDHCHALGLDVTVGRGQSGDLHLGWTASPGQKVSVLLVGATGDGALAKAAQLVRKTDYNDFEILFAAPESSAPDERLRAVSVKAGASLAEQVETLEAAASGDVLVLLDAEASPAGPSWLLEISAPLQHGEIGIVGARLLDPDTRVIRHCGLVITREGNVEAPYAGQPEHVYEVFGGAGWYRNWSAVSGGCLAIRRETWKRLGGLAGEMPCPRLDVHLCLKLTTQTPLRILYNPYATLWIAEEPALARPLPGDTERGRAALRALFPDGDPYFNPGLTCRHGRVGFRPGASGSTVVAHDYAAESRMLVQWFDTTAQSVEESKRLTSRSSGGPLRTINWILPEFANPFYGGIHTILRFADAFQRKAQVESRFCFLGDVPVGRMRSLIASAFPQLAASRVYSLRGVDRVNELPESDASICTLWTTAYPLLGFRRTRQKFYFMQDDEALFYPAGSTSALVEATYRFGFSALCNTASLLKRYESAGGRGEYFSPCVDASVFHARNRRVKASGEPYMLFCYARPHHPRNCFELVAEALRKLKDRMRSQVRILAAGEAWDPAAYGLQGVVENLGLLDYRSTGALYRACDAGTALMMTRHPSYLPLELMACGAMVITNRNPDTAWLLRDEENCLLADPTPSALAARIETGLRDTAMRNRIAAQAAAEISSQFAGWDGAAERIFRYMQSELERP
ncbi:MAG: glycosyltransferase [Acidobacteriota bacterium]